MPTHRKLSIGEAAEIRAKRVRKKKTDREDARHILRLLLEDRFPRIWVPSNRGDYCLTASNAKGKLPAKGTPTASHTLRPYCLHSITARYYSLDKRLQTTSGRSHPC